MKIGWYDANGEIIVQHLYTSKAFFDKGTSVLYLDHSNWPSMQHTSHAFSQIAKGCNAILDGLLDSEHVNYLQSALDSQSPNEMNRKLSESKIPEYSDETTGDSRQDEYQLGAIVPSDIRHLLDHDPYNHFYNEEIVGYERTLDDLPHSLHNETASSSGKTTEVIFAKIDEGIDESEEEINLSRRFRIDIGGKDHIIVTVTTLYKFLRPKETPEMTAVLFTGETTAEVPPASTEESFSDILKRDREQIKREVEEAFLLPGEERRRVLLRLFRKWHPDKNVGQEERTNEAFKFLQEEIKKRESKSQFSRQFPFWESEARRDREDARKYQHDYNKRWGPSGRSRFRANQSSGAYVPPSFTRETPDPRSARLWFRQAEEHFENAVQTKQLLPCHTQWIAFQVHQAAEIALKAAQYSLDGNPDLPSNDLMGLARAVCRHRDVGSSELLNKARELERLDCQFNKPRYPQTCTAQTSGKVYEGACAEDALRICEELLKIVRDIIGTRA